MNAASFAGGQPVAPGSIASAFGTYPVSSVSGATEAPLPNNLQGISLQFGNGSQAPLFFVSSMQVNFQVPWELAGESTATLAAVVNGQTGAAQTVNLAPFAPGIFTLDATGSGPGAILDANYNLVNSANPAVPGSTTLLIYCTGLGAVSNTPATGSPAPSSPLAETIATPIVTIGGVQATVAFSGLAPGYVGLYQVNVPVPAAAAAGSAVALSISIGGQTSNTVTIPVAAAVPEVYQGLYSQLNQDVADFIAATNTACSGCSSYPVLWAGEAADANANVGYAALSSLSILEAQIDHLHGLGFNGIAIEAGFPLMLPDSPAGAYPSFYGATSASLGTTGLNCPGDNQTGGATPTTAQLETGGGNSAAKQAAYVNLYGTLATYARTKYGMKVIVAEELFGGVLESTRGYGACASKWYAAMTFPQFNAARAAQSVAVAEAMLPDYLILSEEPNTEANISSQPIGGNAANAATMLNTIMASVLPLKTSYPGLSGMKVGAGFGNFQGKLDQYIGAYTNYGCGGSGPGGSGPGGTCVYPPMDFLDMHLFLVNECQQGCYAPATYGSYQTNAFKIVGNAAHMPVAISQAWCHKVSDAEWGSPADAGEIPEGREPYSFWEATTDLSFWQLLQAFSNYGQAIYSVPYDTDEMYAYIPWSASVALSGEGGTLTPAQVRSKETTAATAAIAACQISAVGQAVVTSIGGTYPAGCVP